MELADVQKHLLEHYGIRVEEAMSRYVIRRLTQSAAGASAELPVIGGDARTGVPRRLLVDPSTFAAPAAAASVGSVVPS